VSASLALQRPGAEVFVPDGAPSADALRRTTHMGVGAHPDDVEILALHGILECFGRPDRWFCGVVLADGAQSPRGGAYAGLDDAAMREVRRQEQRKAAVVGAYGSAVLLDYPSRDVKDASCSGPVEDVLALLRAARPEVVFTHNPADRHDTHVATALRVVEACRRLRPEERPARLLGGEVWRDLDWMTDSDKLPLDVEAHENLAMALISVFDSQIAGGKRYDLATLGRRRAHATYQESHGLDATSALSLAMDLTPLVRDDALDVSAFARGFVERFGADVEARIGRCR
jgi:LmbE family N-acetylglucosaminyl deacetylase